ncbi:MAG: redoxin domain-containing protein [Verrucomicrobia bacterium]|nr:redoxin domain-containing protein [Verrucomicrobiota bacterium]
MKLRRIALALALIVSFGTAACSRAEPVPATAAPAWKLQSPDGKEISFAQFKGKVVVVDFWATWCGPCRTEIPGYIALQKKHEKDGLVIVGIAVNDTADSVKAYMAKQGINYPIVMGDDAVVEAFGGIEAIPTTFIIDREGKIRERKMGAVNHEEYAATVEKYLK